MNNSILHKIFFTLSLMLLSIGASAQEEGEKITVTGQVVDNTGETIIGATIMEAGTTNGVVTDFDGNFKIDVNSEKATLSVTYVGLQWQIIHVGFQS